MTAKTSPARRAAFIATAKASFDTLRTNGEGMKPASGWGTAQGEELVVRAGNGRRTQIARARLKQWTPRVEARFLAALAGCCNVKAACAAVGLTQASAYNHRRRWPALAGRWAEAMELGYLRIEAALFEAPGIEPDPAMPVPGFDAAIRPLRMHQRQVRGCTRIAATGGAMCAQSRAARGSSRASDHRRRSTGPRHHFCAILTPGVVAPTGKPVNYQPKWTVSCSTNPSSVDSMFRMDRRAG